MFSIYRITYEVDHDKLRKERSKMGISQKAFAKMAGISTAFICDIENGRRTVTERTKEKIERALQKMWDVE